MIIEAIKIIFVSDATYALPLNVSCGSQKMSVNLGNLKLKKWKQSLSRIMMEKKIEVIVFILRPYWTNGMGGV